VEGTTLEKLAAQGRIPLDQALDYAMQVLAALNYAHGKGVIHRDIKPANIMITSHGLVKLMDFGIAKSTNDMNLTRPGTTMGSVYYMSPEQVRGGTIDARSDLYSLGVTLYEMLTGRKPFQADTSYSVLNAQLNQAPTPPLEVNPAIPPELNNIGLHALAKAPEQRFQTADEFRNALKALREPLTAQAPQAAAAAAQYAASPAPSFISQPEYAASQPPPFTPVPPPMAPLATPTGTRQRSFWIGLGAAIALLALLAVAWVVPRMLSTHANPKPTPPPDDTPASVTPASQPPASAPDTTAQPTTATPPDTHRASPASAEPASAKPSASKPLTHAQTTSAPSAPSTPRQPYVSPAASAASTAASSEAASPAAAPEGPSPRDLREAHERYANLQARADAALAGVQQIRSQQQAQGLDIRGDILTGMNRLHHQLTEAQRALDEKDLATANEFMNRADNEVEKLEKFQGR
jgi:serine/threonine-protein kinase